MRKPVTRTSGPPFSPQSGPADCGGIYRSGSECARVAGLRPRLHEDHYPCSADDDEDEAPDEHRQKSGGGLAIGHGIAFLVVVWGNSIRQLAGQLLRWRKLRAIYPMTPRLPRHPPAAPLLDRERARRPRLEDVACGRIGLVRPVPVTIRAGRLAVSLGLVGSRCFATRSLILGRMGLHKPPPNVRGINTFGFSGFPRLAASLRTWLPANYRTAAAVLSSSPAIPS
jgi:hypothetical protein